MVLRTFLFAQSLHAGLQKWPVQQPSKLKFLLGHHLATNSFGLGRPFYRSRPQLQNFRRHGDQKGPNLEGCPRNHSPDQRPSNGAVIFYDLGFSAELRSCRFVTSK